MLLPLNRFKIKEGHGSDHGSCGIDTVMCISLVTKTWRTNLCGSDWQTEKQGHCTLNSRYKFVLSQEAFKGEGVKRTNTVNVHL